MAQHHNFIENDWTSAVNISKSTLRPIFVFATIKGCKPCIEMERKVFSDPVVKGFLDDNFVSLRINGQLGQGKLFAKTNHIVFYPIIIIYDSAQKVIHKTNPSLLKSDFFKSCQLALDPKTRTPALVKRFETQKVDSSFLKEYIKILSDEESNTSPAIDSLFRIRPLVINSTTVQYLNYLNSCKSEFLDFFIKNRSKYFNTVDVAPYIQGVFYRTTQRLFTFGYFSESEYRFLRKKIEMAKIVGWESQLSDLDTYYKKYKLQ